MFTGLFHYFFVLNLFPLSLNLLQFLKIQTKPLSFCTEWAFPHSHCTHWDSSCFFVGDVCSTCVLLPLVVDLISHMFISNITTDFYAGHTSVWYRLDGAKHTRNRKPSGRNRILPVNKLKMWKSPMSPSNAALDIPQHPKHCHTLLNPQNFKMAPLVIHSLKFCLHGKWPLPTSRCI